MVYPPLIPPLTKVSGLTESVDIMPTICEACDIELPSGKSMDGRSLFGFIRRPEVGKESVFTQCSIRTPEYKYIFGEDLLYHVESDPDEEENIAKYEPQIKEQLKKVFKR